MNKQELIEYISRKQEAIEFWGYLNSVAYQQDKLRSLRADIDAAKREMNRLEGRILDIRLNWMAIKNFKGLRDFRLEVKGQNAAVYGDNGAGKTTNMDAFLWLLFGKDSSDRSNFKARPQDENGKDIHHLQTEVEAELLLDDTSIKLKKMLEEKWTRKRGSEEAELTGNTISYWWNEVPVKEGEYKRKISELIDENIFRMLTNPMYFNASLKWQDRRNILLEICGDMTDEQVIKADKKLARLTEVLQGRSVDDYKKVLADKLKGLEKERANIPPRIDELTLSLPERAADYSATEAELKGYQMIISGIEKKMVDASDIANVYRKKQQELYSLKTKLDEVKARVDEKATEGRRKLIKEKAEQEDAKMLLESNIDRLKTSIEQNQEALKSYASEREKLLAEWRELNETKAAQMALQFEKLDKTKAAQMGMEFIEPDENSFVCPTCGQELPEDDKEAKLAEMADNFEKERQKNLDWVAKQLGTNKEKGLKIKENKEATQKNIDDAMAEIQEKHESIAKIVDRISKIDKALSAPEAQVDYSKDAEYSELSAKIRKLQIELDKPIDDQTGQLIQKKNEIQEKINDCNGILFGKSKAEETKKRIEELKEEEKRVANLITDLEGQKYLLEQFVVSKVNLLEDSINSHFGYVRFKMFDVQINGGIAETCEALINTNGSYVPFAEANHAGKVNAGIDCINVLSSFYGVTAPIFVDFSESVSEYVDTDSQIISLVKPETFDKLDKILQDALIEEYGTYEAAKKFWNDRNKVLRVEVVQ